MSKASSLPPDSIGRGLQRGGGRNCCSAHQPLLKRRWTFKVNTAVFCLQSVYATHIDLMNAL